MVSSLKNNQVKIRTFYIDLANFREISSIPERKIKGFIFGSSDCTLTELSKLFNESYNIEEIVISNGSSDYAKNIEIFISSVVKSGVKKLVFNSFAIKYSAPFIRPILGLDSLEFRDCKLPDFNIQDLLTVNKDLIKLFVDDCVLAS